MALLPLLPALLANLWPWGKRAAEGQYRPGPYYLDQGWLGADAGRLWNWWQTGYQLQPFGEPRAMVEACVSAYAQTVAMCPGDHWRKLPDGGRERVAGSALTRILKRPNDYQSMSDVLMNLTRRLYERGEAFAVVFRNNRNEISELHLMREGRAMIAGEGSIFYALWGNEVIASQFNLVENPTPARDVLHVRLHTPRHVLRGESPILSAALDLALSGSAMTQQVNFYQNQARPSFLLETEAQMKREQMEELRAWWDAQTQGENAGKTPILGWGLKANPITTTAVDAQLAEMLKMSDQNIALTMRIPLAILGISERAQPAASTEALMGQWIASGLGFCLNHIEEAFGLLFGLRGMPEEYLEFDTKALLRSAYRDRIEALARGVISGIYSPDEARASEDLPAVPDGVGAEPRVQQQVVPLSYGADMKAPEPGAAVPPPPSGGANGSPDGAPADEGNGTDDSQASVADLAAVFRSSHERHSLAA
jgi:HK97 family phage portal protein